MSSGEGQGCRITLKALTKNNFQTLVLKIKTQSEEEGANMLFFFIPGASAQRLVKMLMAHWRRAWELVFVPKSWKNRGYILVQRVKKKHQENQTGVFPEGLILRGDR